MSEDKLQDPYCITAYELMSLGKEQIPDELLSSKHLIYSSPATLAFNSPGAQGFGVKRAALAIPGSVELLVAPGCCGRNTTMLSQMGGYAERFFYLLMDDTDIVTGRHLNKISKAVRELVESLKEKPSAVMICITCVDALLGTDMERVCRKAQEEAGVPVLPAYMYALTREGRVPPMPAVRKSVYSLLTPRRRKASSVNLLGEFAPFMEETELYELLKQIGIRRINEIAKCQTFEEYLEMAEVNFNLVLNPECRYAAADLEKRLHIPFIELTRVYQPDKIHRQYELLGGAVGKKIDDSIYYEKAKEHLETFSGKFSGLKIAIGECINANPFELALCLLQAGIDVKELYVTVTPEQFVYIRKIAAINPDLKIYTNLSPTMLYYDVSEEELDLTLGKDAGYYHPDCPNVAWNQEIVPFGFAGLKRLLDEMEEALKGETV